MKTATCKIQNEWYSKGGFDASFVAITSPTGTTIRIGKPELCMLNLSSGQLLALVSVTEGQSGCFEKSLSFDEMMLLNTMHLHSKKPFKTRVKLV